MYRFYESPNRLAEALKLKAEHGAAACFIAGGTDLLIDLARDGSPESARFGKREARYISVPSLPITNACAVC